MMKRRVNPPWADLPQELLSIIVSSLNNSNHIDILTFRSICKSWNSSSPPLSDLSPFNLSHMLPLTCSVLSLSKLDRRFIRPIPGFPIISVTAIFALRQKRFSNMEWLIFVDQLTPGKLMIRQPLTKYHYSTPLNFPSGIDVTNIHVDEVARFYNLSFHPEMNRPPSMWSEHVQKVVVNSDESRVFALLHTGRVGWSRLIIDHSSYSSCWDFLTPFGGFNNDDGRINDIVYHETRLLGVDHVGRVYVRDFSTSTEKIMESPITGSCTKRKRLVVSNGLVYLVVREEINKALGFKIFELDEDLNKCVEVDSIGDMVFFFGLEFSFSVSAEKLGGSFRKNCIVFIENSFKDGDDGVVDDDVTLFSNLSLGDLRIGVWHMEDPYHIGTIGSYPGCSNILWPPPSWLWPVDMSKRIGDLEAALNDLLVNAPAQKLKGTSKQKPPLEEAIVVGDDANEQDISVIWRAAHTVQVYLNEAKESHKRLKSIKSKNVVISREMKLNAILLHLEETTTKLLKVMSIKETSMNEECLNFYDICRRLNPKTFPVVQHRKDAQIYQYKVYKVIQNPKKR